MEEKLRTLYNECISELKSINIDIENESVVGKIDIDFAKRKSKRYGCCKQEEPDRHCFHYVKRGFRKYKVYDRFKVHHIEISKWVMDLDDSIIKNTIMHEIIHCLPECNNHGEVFKKYANYINTNLDYNISRVGNKKQDYEKSNVDYEEERPEYKYQIICQGCGQTFYRQRLQRNFTRKYRCGKCNGKFEVKDGTNSNYFRYSL